MPGRLHNATGRTRQWTGRIRRYERDAETRRAKSLHRTLEVFLYQVAKPLLTFGFRNAVSVEAFANPGDGFGYEPETQV